MGEQENSKHVPLSDKLLDVLAADLGEFLHHKIVGVYKNLQEELNALLSNVKVP